MGPAGWSCFCTRHEISLLVSFDPCCISVSERLLHTPRLVVRGQSKGCHCLRDYSVHKIGLRTDLMHCGYNTSWGHVACGNSYPISKATDSPLQAWRRTNCPLMLVVCKGTAKKLGVSARHRRIDIYSAVLRKYHFDGFVQGCSISSANTLEILQSWTKPPILDFFFPPHGNLSTTCINVKTNTK